MLWPVGYTSKRGCMPKLENLTPRNPTERSFLEFHEKNPLVYATLVDLARRAKRQGRDKLAIDMLHSVARWNHWMAVDRAASKDDFLLNNNHRPYYARLIMLQEPELFRLLDVRRIEVPSVLEELYTLRLREEP